MERLKRSSRSWAASTRAVLAKTRLAWLSDEKGWWLEGQHVLSFQQCHHLPNFLLANVRGDFEGAVGFGVRTVAERDIAGLRYQIVRKVSCLECSQLAMFDLTLQQSNAPHHIVPKARSLDHPSARWPLFPGSELMSPTSQFLPPKTALEH